MKVISVENVSKKFMLPQDRPRNLADAARAFVRGARKQEFWALTDANFAVEQGEALGIIGHNGAGKSTMLKLLTKIMLPTSGRIRTRGRVSALIEVGAGFHPEMTGRENIYLNGSILGMSRREIDGKFDEIVAFAELERFIDTPVKRYSSGMYARLGFAVAAHVQPDVLVVDEVLSVGDMAFQNRCIEHMQGLRKDGCTVVFVSHNMQAIASMCDRCVVLAMGEVHFNGDVAQAVKEYANLTYSVAREKASNFSNKLLEAKACTGGASIQRVSLLDPDGHAVNALTATECASVSMRVKFNENAKSPVPSFYIRRNDGLLVYDTTANWLGVDCGEFRAGDVVDFVFSLGYLPIKAGSYDVTAEVAYSDLSMYYDSKPGIVPFQMYDARTSHGILELPVKLQVLRVAEGERV